VIPAIVTYTWRACVPLRRLVGLGLLVVATLLFGLIGRAVNDAPPGAFATVANSGLFGLVLPLAGLVVGDAVLGAEVRKGTFHFTWLSPIPRWRIAVGRWMAGTAVIGTSMGPAFLVAGLIAGTSRGGWAAAAVSLALVFLGERLLGTVLSGVAQWSPQWEAGAVFTGWSDGVSSRNGIPSGTGAVVRLVLITAIGLGLTTWRLRKLKLAGPGD
jgi:ABC-type transport system involved in multi-copper enzyme maturation permease subunit